MQTTIRTTIRLRKDLFDQSRRLAFQRKASLQEVINETLAHGFGHLTDLDVQEMAFDQIQKFRDGLEGQQIDFAGILEESKKDLK